MTFNSADLCLRAARVGLGLAILAEAHVADDLRSGRLVRALEPFTPVFTGFHLYHSSRRQMPPALALVIEKLRFKGDHAA